MPPKPKDKKRKLKQKQKQKQVVKQSVRVNVQSSGGSGGGGSVPPFVPSAFNESRLATLLETVAKKVPVQQPIYVPTGEAIPARNVEENEEIQTLIKYMIPFEESLKIQEPPASEPEPENTITVIHHDIEEPKEIIKPEDPPYRLPVGKT